MLAEPVRRIRQRIFVDGVRLVGAGVGAHELIGFVEDLEHDVLRVRLEPVVDGGAFRGILAHRLLRRNRRIGVLRAADAPRLLRLEKHARGCGRAIADLTQVRDVVEDPEGAAMRADHDVVFVNHEIADGGRRHVGAQRMPVVAVVDGEINGPFRTRIQQAFALGILAHGVHGLVRGDAVDDEFPCEPAVVRAIDVGPKIAQAQLVDRSVDGVVVEVRGVELRDFVPRLQIGRRDVLPVPAAIAREVDESIVRSGPDGVEVLM